MIRTTSKPPSRGATPACAGRPPSAAMLRGPTRRDTSRFPGLGPLLARPGPAYVLMPPDSSHRECTRIAVAEHRIEKGQVHYKWDNAQRPVVDIESGDIVHCETNEV